MGIARGEPQTYKIWDTMQNYFQGYQASVDLLIEKYGLAFVFGEGFNFYTLFEKVLREIVCVYLREHEIEAI